MLQMDRHTKAHGGRLTKTRTLIGLHAGAKGTQPQFWLCQSETEENLLSANSYSVMFYGVLTPRQALKGQMYIWTYLSYLVGSRWVISFFSSFFGESPLKRGGKPFSVGKEIIAFLLVKIANVSSRDNPILLSSGWD